MGATGDGCADLPISERFPVRLGSTDRQELAAHARDIARRDPELRWVPGNGLATGLAPGPALIVHDLSANWLLGAPRPSPFEYRGVLLARPRDRVAVRTPRSPPFEEATAGLLDIDQLRVHEVPGAEEDGLAHGILEDEPLLDAVTADAHSAGAFTVRPYQSNRGVWELAGEIHRRSGAEVRVEGPPAALSERVNHKVWFGDAVERILGPDAAPPSAAAFNLRDLVTRVRRMSDGERPVVVKLPSTGGGQGNLVLEGSTVASADPDELARRLARLLRRTGFSDAFPVEVEIWEEKVLASPSAQLWIPHADRRGPVVEGVFEQRVDPEAGEFAGLQTSKLPPHLQDEIARQAVRIATVFQHLGYFGRCSFDTLLIGDTLDRCTLHWIECNGRWGGASIPMTLVERLTGDWTRTPFVLVSEQLDRPPMPVLEAYDRLHDLLFQPGGEEGVLLVSPTRLEDGTGLDLLAIADGPGAAATLAEEAEHRLED